MTIEQDVAEARAILAANPAIREACANLHMSEDEYIYRWLAQKYGEPQIIYSTSTTFIEIPA